MAKRNIAAVVAAPTSIAFGTTPIDVLANLRVVDAATGEPLIRVITADSDAGKVSRYAVDDGNLVRKDDAFVVIEEDRKILIEWIEPPVADAEGEGESGQEG